MGFGDSQNDISFLKEVDFPVAINPDEKLKNFADSKSWLSLNKEDDILNNFKKAYFNF